MADNPIGTTIGDETFAAQDSETITFMEGLPPNYKELPLPQQKELMADLAKLMARIAGRKVAAHALVWEPVTVDPTSGTGLDRPMPSVCQQFTTGGVHVAFWFKIGDDPTQWATIGGNDWGEIDFDPSVDGHDRPPKTIVWQVDDDGLPVALWLKHGDADEDWDKVWPTGTWDTINFNPSAGSGYDQPPKTIVWQVTSGESPDAIWVKAGVGNTDWSKIWPIDIPVPDISLPAPFALYQFWRGTSYGLKDTSGHQLDLSMATGSETYTESITSGQGFLFASGRYLASSAAEFRTLDSLSVEVSFYFAALPAATHWGCLVTVDGPSGSSGGSNCLFVLALLPSGKLKIAYEYSDAHIESLVMDEVLEVDTAYHVVVARAATSTHVYLNGSLIGDLVHTQVEDGQDSVLNVGKFAADADSEFSGIISSLAFYNSVLTGEMASHHFHDAVMRWGTRPSSGNVPASHAASHEDGGSDEIEVTETLLSFSDTTTGNAATGQHGLLKKLSGTATEFMNGAGNWAVPYTSEFTTAYEVDFTSLTAQNLLTGGNGNKTVDGKTWVLANSANLQTCYLNDGTHNGLYFRCNTNNSGNQGTTLASGALYIPLSSVSGDLPKYQLHREIWIWCAHSFPHLMDANYEIMQLGVFAGTPYTAANLNRVSIMSYYSDGRGYGHTHICLSGTDSGAEGGSGTARDVFAIRIIDGILVETYYGNMPGGGGWPNKTDMNRSSRVAFGTTGRITRDNWHVGLSCGSGNTVGAADFLIARMKIEYK